MSVRHEAAGVKVVVNGGGVANVVDMAFKCYEDCSPSSQGYALN